jgi:hypothetical protein
MGKPTISMGHGFNSELVNQWAFSIIFLFIAMVNHHFLMGKSIASGQR